MKNRIIKSYKQIIFIPSVILLILFAIYFFALPVHYKYIIRGIYTTDTELQFIAYRYQRADKIRNGLYSLLLSSEKILSEYLPNSEVSLINQKAFEKDIPLSNDLYPVIKKSLYYGKLSDGKFDISILPLIRLWKAIDKNDQSIPSSTQIQDTMKLVDYKSILLKNNKIRFLKKDMQIGLGAISKGYIIDKCIDYLKKQGIKNALLKIGGDLYALGNKLNKKKWLIEIKNPRIDQISGSGIAYVYLQNKALSTSGDYERYRLSKSGMRIHHIIDPKTGYPSTKSISVSIIAPKTIDSDALSTAVFLMGPENGIHLINNLKNVEGLIIYEKNKEIKWIMSKGFPLEKNIPLNHLIKK